MQSPVIPLAWFAKITSRNFYKAIVQGQIVSNRILPFLLIAAKIWESHHNVLVDFVQCSHAIWGAVNGHCYQCNVRKWRLHFFGEVRLASRLHGRFSCYVVSLRLGAFYIGSEERGLDRRLMKVSCMVHQWNIRSYFPVSAHRNQHSVSTRRAS